jgi:acyl carrier protein
VSDNVARLQQAFVSALGLTEPLAFEALSYRETAAWDSVAHMQLVAAIEAAFDLMLDTDDVIGMSSYGKACEIVTRHGVTL